MATCTKQSTTYKREYGDKKAPVKIQLTLSDVIHAKAVEKMFEQWAEDVDGLRMGVVPRQTRMFEDDLEDDEVDVAREPAGVR